MTTLTIDVTDFGAATDRRDFVFLYAPEFRGSTLEAGRMVSTAKRRVPLPAGKATVEKVEPGALVVEFHVRNITGETVFPFNVPAEGTHSLRDLLENHFDYTPPVVSEVASLRDQAVEARDRTEVIASAFGSLDGVESEVQAARDAAAAAAGSATSAAGSASSAAGSAESAEASKVSAAGSATAAAQSAVNAANSEWVAGEHKGSAETAAAAAVAARTAADGSAVAAAGSATDADAAKTAAESARDESVAAAGSAVADVRLEFEESVSSAAGSAAAAQLSAGEALAQANRSKAEADRAEAAAQSAETGVQPDTVGRVHLTPELRGEIDEKVTAEHEHTIEQVTGLETALDGKSDVGHRHPWSQVDDKPSTYPPESHDHTALQISDATATGRAVLTASSAAAARQAIGAGTSSLTLGTTSSTAAQGDHTHTPASIGAAPASHTHSQYAESSRVSALEGNAPIIVSSLPSSPLPGRIYMVTG